MVKRIAALGAVLLTVSACSRLPTAPTAYSALPPVTLSNAAAPLATSAVPAEIDVALAQVVIPGTLKRSVAESGTRGVNPTTVLEASMRTHMAWELLRPADLLKPPALVARSVAADVAETGATSVTKDPGTSKPTSVAAVALIYDREATMDRLVKGGQDAAKAICSGC